MYLSTFRRVSVCMSSLLSHFCPLSMVLRMISHVKLVAMATLFVNIARPRLTGRVASPPGPPLPCTTCACPRSPPTSPRCRTVQETSKRFLQHRPLPSGCCTGTTVAPWTCPPWPGQAGTCHSPTCAFLRQTGQPVRPHTATPGLMWMTGRCRTKQQQEQKEGVKSSYLKTEEKKEKEEVKPAPWDTGENKAGG